MRRHAHSTPAVNSSHKVGFVSDPWSLAPGKLRRSPQNREGSSVEPQSSAGPQPGASQRAEVGHPAQRCASRAIAGRGSRTRARGSAGLP